MSVIWERFTAQQLPGANRLFPLSAARGALPGLTRSLCRGPGIAPVLCLKNPPFVLLSFCPARAPRWCQRDAAGAGVPRLGSLPVQGCAPAVRGRRLLLRSLARKHQACWVSGWDTSPQGFTEYGLYALALDWDPLPPARCTASPCPSGGARKARLQPSWLSSSLAMRRGLGFLQPAELQLRHEQAEL